MNDYRKALEDGQKLAEYEERQALNRAEQAAKVWDVLMGLSDTRERNNKNLAEKLEQLRLAKKIVDDAIVELEAYQKSIK